MIRGFERWRWHVGAALVYAGCAWFVTNHGTSFTHQIAGGGSEAFLFMWFLAWWPWALLHHVSPFFTNLVWQPAGLNLTWTTSVPLLAIISLPFTLLSGPALSYNVLTLAGPFLAAYSAYALCFYITKIPVAALLGGYFFGFSAYEMARASAQLNLDFTLCVPLLMLVILTRLDNRLERRPTVFWCSFLLIFQFGISVEVFATMFLFGCFAWVLAIWRLPARRPELWRLLQDGLIAAPFVVLFISPFLWVMFTVPANISLPLHWPIMFSTDLMNFVVPTMATWIGSNFELSLTSHFTGFLSEQSGYLGLPLLIILWLYIRAERWFLGLLLIGIMLASLGPQLWFGGVRTNIFLPWNIIQHLPFYDAALPARFMLYASLVVAVIVALWVADATTIRNRNIRFIGGLIAAIWIFPTPHPVQNIPYSTFFEPGRLQMSLGPHAHVLIVPFGIMGASSLWQLENKFGFAQTGGYLGYPPEVVQSNMSVMRFYFGLDTPGLSTDFAKFCQTTNTDFVVAGPGTTAHDMAMMHGLAWQARRFDDVTVFTVPKG